MSVPVGRKAPNFTTQAVKANGEIVDDYNFKAARDGKYAVVFFTQRTSILCVHQRSSPWPTAEKLQELGCEVVGISIDSHWTRAGVTPRSTVFGAVPFTLAADMSRKISILRELVQGRRLYYPKGVSMRATFVIDQAGIVRHQVVNDEPPDATWTTWFAWLKPAVLRAERPGLPSWLEIRRCRHDQHQTALLHTSQRTQAT